MSIDNTSFVELSIPMIALARMQGNDLETYIEREIEYRKHELAIHMLSRICESKTPVVVEVHLEKWQDPMEYCLKFRIHYRLTTVRSMDVVFPNVEPLTFTNHLGVIEWKCPYCGIINTIEATYCGEKHEHAVGCGKPREKTRQDMYV